MKKLTEEIEKVVDLMMREEEKSLMEEDIDCEEMEEALDSEEDSYEKLMEVSKKYGLDNHLFLSLLCLNNFLEGKKISMEKIEEELTKVVNHMYQNELDHFYADNEEVYNTPRNQDKKNHSLIPKELRYVDYYKG